MSRSARGASAGMAPVLYKFAAERWMMRWIVCAVVLSVALIGMPATVKANDEVKAPVVAVATTEEATTRIRCLLGEADAMYQQALLDPALFDDPEGWQWPLITGLAKALHLSVRHAPTQ